MNWRVCTQSYSREKSISVKWNTQYLVPRVRLFYYTLTINSLIHAQAKFKQVYVGSFLRISTLALTNAKTMLPLEFHLFTRGVFMPISQICKKKWRNNVNFVPSFFYQYRLIYASHGCVILVIMSIHFLPASTKCITEHKRKKILLPKTISLRHIKNS